MSDIPRVIAGDMGGLRIEAPRGNGTRPTTDRVKESIFSMIMQYIQNGNVLDLFAGSGSLGIEALSRGADYAVFVETDGDTVKIIRKNIAFCRLEERAEVIRDDFVKVLERLSVKGLRYDIIFVDPPYGTGMLQTAVDKIFRLDLLSESGIIVAEHPAKEACTNNVCAVTIRKKVYGDTAVSIVKRKG